MACPRITFVPLIISLLSASVNIILGTQLNKTDAETKRHKQRLVMCLLYLCFNVYNGSRPEPQGRSYRPSYKSRPNKQKFQARARAVIQKMPSHP